MIFSHFCCALKYGIKAKKKMNEIPKFGVISSFGFLNDTLFRNRFVSHLLIFGDMNLLLTCMLFTCSSNSLIVEINASCTPQGLNQALESLLCLFECVAQM